MAQNANDAVEIQLKKDRIPLIRTKIGSPYVIAAMNTAISEGKTAVVGWEVNGGFLTGTDFLLNKRILKALPTRDAVLPIIAVLLKAVSEKSSISKLFARLPKRYTQAGRLDRFPPESSKKIIDKFSISSNTKDNRLKLERYFKPEFGFNAIINIDYTDGIKINFKNGDSAHIRPSGNSPQLRIYALANSQERADEIVRLGISEKNGILRKMQRDLCANEQKTAKQATIPSKKIPAFLKKEPLKLKFGTSGLRSFVKDMTDLECYINTRGFIEYLITTEDIQKGACVCIAGDLRPSTKTIMEAIAKAIKDSGCNIKNCGRIPSPALAYYAKQKNQASIMVTGSHIPDDQNGIKFNKSGGEVLKSDEKGILAEVAKIRQEEYSKSRETTLFNKDAMFKS